MAYIEKQGKRWRVRYSRPDRSLGSVSGFRTKTEALHYAQDLDTDRHRGLWLDPQAGRIPLFQWASTWFEALDVAPATEAQYRSLTRNHILPRWGTTPLADISAISARVWTKQLRHSGYASTTVSAILKIMSMMLDDATDDRLIPPTPSSTGGVADAEATSPVPNRSGPHPTK
ncbi:hypothetical protein [Saccharopolyspora sp. NPDC050642]|uniref:hypothetical protein n=1 Tax=Saccharopolyspora sp. NPDC050642 TaxID=3157099 RepID=UPI0033E7B3A1